MASKESSTNESATAKMSGEKPDLLRPVVSNPNPSKEKQGDPRLTVSHSDATPRTLIENLIQSHDTVQTTTRKRPRIQHSPVSSAKRVQRYSPAQKARITPGSVSPSKSRRRRSIRSANTSLRKRASMNYLMKDTDGPTPRTMIQGFMEDAVEETPVAGSRVRKSTDDLEITPIELDKTNRQSTSFDLSKDSFLSDYPPILTSDRLQMLRTRRQRQKTLLNIEAFAAQLREKVGQSDEDTSVGGSRRRSRGRRTKDLSSDDEWRPPNTSRDSSANTVMPTVVQKEPPKQGLKENEMLVTVEIHPEPRDQSSSSLVSATEERSSSVGNETLVVNSQTEPQLQEEVVETASGNPDRDLVESSHGSETAIYGLGEIEGPMDTEIPQQIEIIVEKASQESLAEQSVNEDLEVRTEAQIHKENEIVPDEEEEIRNDVPEMHANEDMMMRDMTTADASQENCAQQEVPSSSAEVYSISSSKQTGRRSQEKLASVTVSVGGHGPNDETQLYQDVDFGSPEAAAEDDKAEDEEDEEEEDLESHLFTPSQMPRLKQLRISDVMHSPNPLNFLNQMDTQDMNKSLFHMVQTRKDSAKKKQNAPRQGFSAEANKLKRKVDKTKAPRMPSALTKSIFQHFSRHNVPKEVMEEVEKVADDFWKNTISDLSAYASHANRKGVEQKDMDLLMRRQGFVTNKQSLNGLIENYLALEYREELIPIARSGNKVEPKS